MSEGSSREFEELTIQNEKLGEELKSLVISEKRRNDIYRELAKIRELLLCYLSTVGRNTREENLRVKEINRDLKQACAIQREASRVAAELSLEKDQLLESQKNENAALKQELAKVNALLEESKANNQLASSLMGGAVLDKDEQVSKLLAQIQEMEREAEKTNANHESDVDNLQMVMARQALELFQRQEKNRELTQINNGLILDITRKTQTYFEQKGNLEEAHEMIKGYQAQLDTMKLALTQAIANVRDATAVRAENEENRRKADELTEVTDQLRNLTIDKDQKLERMKERISKMFEEVKAKYQRLRERKNKKIESWKTKSRDLETTLLGVKKARDFLLERVGDHQDHGGVAATSSASGSS